MKRFTLSVLTLATVASSFVFTSCKKDDDDPKPKTKTELLTAKNWRITGDVSTITSGGNTITTDEYADYQACEKDDFIKFETNKSAKFDEGANRCSGNTQTETGAWDFNSDESKLLLSDPDNGPVSIPFDLVELTDSTLKIRISGSSNGATYSQTYTYTAF